MFVDKVTVNSPRRGGGGGVEIIFEPPFCKTLETTEVCFL